MKREIYSGLGPPDEQEISERRKICSKISDCIHNMFNNAQIRSVLCEVGLSRDFSESECTLVCEDSGLLAYIGSLDRDLVPLYKASALSLAKRLANGEFQSIFDADAQRYLFDRVVIREYIRRTRDLRISLKDTMMMVKELYESNIYNETLDRVKRYDYSNEINAYDKSEELCQPIFEFSRKICWRYGHITYNLHLIQLIHVLNDIEGSIEDSGAVLEASRRLNLPVQEVGI